MYTPKKKSLLAHINHIESLVRVIKYALLVDRMMPSKQELDSAIYQLESFRDLVENQNSKNSCQANKADLHWESLRSL